MNLMTIVVLFADQPLPWKIAYSGLLLWLMLTALAFNKGGFSTDGQLRWLLGGSLMAALSLVAGLYLAIYMQ